MYIVGANAAGLFNKIESLKRIINLFHPGVIFIQETKAARKNKLKLKDYEIFEHIRKDSGGGGILLALHRSLEPVIVSEGNEDEVITVEAKLGSQRVRFITAYGPQETSPEAAKSSFYQCLDLEIKKVKVVGVSICIEMDSNAKLGPNYIPGDPQPMSCNGKSLIKIVEENNLIVVNGTSLCEGTITRYRETTNSIEESV